MSYQFRIPVEERYLNAVGRATYNFAYLEWAIVWIAEKLNPGYVNSVRGKTAGCIAADFESAVLRQSIDPGLKNRLATLASNFKALVEQRNGLVHANPMTATGGEQRLRDSSKPKKRDAFEFAESDILKLASEFELAAIEANEIFHSALQARN